MRFVFDYTRTFIHAVRLTLKALRSFVDTVLLIYTTYVFDLTAVRSLELALNTAVITAALSLMAME